MFTFTLSLGWQLGVNPNLAPLCGTFLPAAPVHEKSPTLGMAYPFDRCWWVFVARIHLFAHSFNFVA